MGVQLVSRFGDDASAVASASVQHRLLIGVDGADRLSFSGGEVRLWFSPKRVVGINMEWFM